MLECLRSGHFVRQCLYISERYVKNHTTLLHVEAKDNSPTTTPSSYTTAQPITSNAAAGLMSESLLMTCCILVDAPDGSSVEARAILESASSASFVSKHLS